MERKDLENFINEKLESTDLYLVELKISGDNVIAVELDSDTSVNIDECVALTRQIEEAFDRDKEDYELEVGSAGITSPLKVKRQYGKFIGKEMELLTSEGKKFKGVLKEAGPETFTLTVEEKEKPEGSKRPVIIHKDYSFSYGDVKQIKYLLKF